MIRRALAVLPLVVLPLPGAADDEPFRLPPVEVRAPHALVPARYRETPPPTYPAAAREQRLEGTVLLDVHVRPDGRVGQVRVKQTSGSPLLDTAARDSVRQWTFVPARRGARAVESWVEVPVIFSLATP
jgi:protein TonB